MLVHGSMGRYSSPNKQKRALGYVLIKLVRPSVRRLFDKVGGNGVVGRDVPALRFRVVFLHLLEEDAGAAVLKPEIYQDR